jgi:hypothetical protein
MFLIASVAVPRSRITKMVAFRILPNGQFRLEVYERVMSATCVANYHSLTVAGLRGPIVGSGDHKQLLHLHNHQGSIDNVPKEDASPVSVWSQSCRDCPTFRNLHWVAFVPFFVLCVHDELARQRIISRPRGIN